MSDARLDQAAAFLARAGHSGAALAPLAGDASRRRYFRVTGAVLMDAPPELGEDVRPFIRIAEWLRNQGLSAPVIYAEDPDQGFLLIEDLGDAVFARVVARAPGQEAPLYRAAVDVLAHLTAVEPPALPHYDAVAMAPLAGLAGTWYAGDPSLAAALERAARDALAALDTDHPVIVLRDYHAENLLWLPDRDGLQRVGLLDFQDAGLGHPAYDLVSLIHDARRDVDAALGSALTQHFATATGTPLADMARAVATLGAQRNLRILGVFARLSLHFGKPHYVDFIPRVWAHLMGELATPGLEPLREVAAALPLPTDAHLKDLKDRCGTIPTL
ncbi:MAG: phosphotransferase [Pseudomonadota bacterium]